MKAECVSGLQRSREQNPNLTVFDTGEMLEPSATQEAGVIEFTDDSSVPVIGVSAHPSTIHDDTVVLQVDTMGLVDDKLMIVINDGPALCHFNPEVEEPPMVQAQSDIRNAITAYAAFGVSAEATFTRIAEAVGIEVLEDAFGNRYITDAIRSETLNDSSDTKEG